MFNFQKIQKDKNLIFFIKFLGLKILISLLTSSLASYIDPISTKNPIEDFSLITQIIVALLIAPIIESLLFQVLIIELLFKTKLQPIFILIISASVFGLSHNYNWLYSTATVLSGAIYALYYIKLRDQSLWNRFLYIATIHLINNIVSFIP